MKVVKKTLISIVLAAMISLNVNAQLALGFKGGLNCANITGTETSFIPSFHIGLEMQYMFTKGLGLESGLYYSGLGATKDFDINSEASSPVIKKATYRTDYVQVPLLLLCKFKIANDVLLCPYAGGYASYGTGGKAKCDFVSASSDFETSNNFFGGFSNDKNMDAGVSGGVNFEFENYFTHSTYENKTNKIILGVGYERGFMEIYTNDGYLSGFTPKYNQNIKVSFGFLF